MEVIIAEHSGFCTGVRKAVNTAMNLEGKNACILGEIIHNATVVKALKDKGLVTVESLEEVPDGGTVVFRSHGVPENYYGICRERNISVVDCTCSFVRRTQKIVKSQCALGKEIIIVGEHAHPEVIGLLGWCGGNARVIDNPDGDISEFVQKDLCIVCQTTFSEQKLEKIIKKFNL